MIQQMEMLFGKVMELLQQVLFGKRYSIHQAIVTIPESLTALENTLFFTGYDSTNGWALWKSDGTAVGTVLVKDTDTWGIFNGPESLTAVGKTLFFRGYDTINGWALWKSDGTTAGTVMVKDLDISSIYNGPESLTAVGNDLFLEVMM